MPAADPSDRSSARAGRTDQPAAHPTPAAAHSGPSGNPASHLDPPGQPTTAQAGGELAALEWLASVLSPPPPGETWIGDDAAVIAGPAGGGPLLLATDCLAEGVHFERSLSSLGDVGWKALAVNVSDVAAMGGDPLRAVVAVAGASGGELRELTAGIVEAAGRFGCPLVGGDLSSARQLVVSVAIVGTCPGGPPVLRSGAKPGDALWVTGPLGAAAAGLRLLRADPDAMGPLVEAHRRPVALLAEGAAAREAGATAMIDCSDGLGLDVARIARASGVGVEIDGVPIADGATGDEALSGGEDYVLVFTAPETAPVAAAFAARGLIAPLRIGRCSADPAVRLLAGSPLPVAGYEHRLG